MGEIRKIGVLGGTFDPPHRGHIRAALLAADKLGLEKVLLIPTNIAPHKSSNINGASPSERLDMIKIAVRESEILVADGREINRGGTSYTYDTVKGLKNEYKNAQFWFICGTDMFMTVHKWYRAEELLKEISLAAFPRARGDMEKLNGQKLFLETEYSANAEVIDCEPLDISSSGIRSGRGSGELMLPEVFAYAEEKGLYGLIKKDCNQ